MTMNPQCFKSARIDSERLMRFKINIALLKNQRNLATIWSKSIRDTEVDIAYIEENLDTITDPAVLHEVLNRVKALWSSFESTHTKYIPGIKKPQRQEETRRQFTDLQMRFSNIIAESELLSDAQKVEYLPKFLCGKALEVVRRNRGCNFKTLMDTLEERYGQSTRIAQACIRRPGIWPQVGPQ